MRKKTQAEFIAEATAKHNGFYGYGNSDYKGSKIKIEITCPIHGPFRQIPDDHLRGSGCSKCGDIKAADARRKSQSGFIAEATAAHNGFYSYPNSDYRGDKIKVEIECPVHGPFRQTPHDHLAPMGCLKCGFIKGADAQRKSAPDFIAESTDLYNGFYGYPNVDYKNSTTPVEIKCPIHGPYMKKPSKHLSGQGCTKCAHTQRGATLRSNTAEFLVKAKKMAGADNHLFDRVDYKTALKKVWIGCKTEGHGYWPVTPNSYLDGSGCPSCAVSGFNQAKPGRLYYLRVDVPEGVLYKIGITNHTVAKRYLKRDREKIEIIDEITYEVGADAYAAEQLILRHFSTMRRDHDRDNPVLANGGDTELLHEHVLGVGDLQRMITACREYDSALQLAS